MGCYPKDVKKRLADKILKLGDDECWPWIGAADAVGRGHIWFEGRLRKAAQVILITEGKPQPKAPNDYSLHNPKCLPSCSNPKHLRWGSHAENMLDKKVAGTTAIKLTEEAVLQIRSSPLKAKDLCKIYKVKRQTIEKVRARQIWTHI